MRLKFWSSYKADIFIYIIYICNIYIYLFISRNHLLPYNLPQSKDTDMHILMHNYTAPALAAGLRAREETLQVCAQLLKEGDHEMLRKVLHPYEEHVIMKRRTKARNLDLSHGIYPKHLNMLRKYLHRMPRQITRAVSLRASVIIPLCNVDGVASILFQKRSASVRSFKSQVNRSLYLRGYGLCTCKRHFQGFRNRS